MPRRSAVYLALALSLSLAAVLGSGCSRSRESKPAEATPAKARSLAAIWADVLTQRDVMHQIFMKKLEDVTHEDCSELGVAARRLDTLTTELTNQLGGMSGQDAGRLRQIGDVITRISAVINKIRDSALAESPGAWPQLRFPLDQSLRLFESYFSVADLGSESVTNRPGFETEPPPAALSPI
jgi:hypothetical protein